MVNHILTFKKRECPFGNVMDGKDPVLAGRRSWWLQTYFLQSMLQP